MAKRKQVLVVEDEADIRQALMYEIRQEGYMCSQADNGERALRLVLEADRDGRAFDLLITDIEMPILSGLELLSEMRLRNINTPFLAISGRGTTEIIRELNELGGCEGFLVKPFSPRDIVTRIRKVLGCGDTMATHLRNLLLRKESASPDASKKTEREKSIISAVDLFKGNPLKAPEPASDEQDKQKQLQFLDLISLFSSEINSMLEAPNLILPILPEAAIQVQRAITNDEMTLESIAEVVSLEPALAARILRVANSPVYAGLKRVRNLDTAVGRLGLQEVGNILSAILARPVFKSKNPFLERLMRDLWKHCICTAYANEIVARLIDLKDTRDYFIMGLLHDIGKLLILHLAQEGLASGQWKKEMISEDILFPFFAMRHNDLGARLMENWDYPLLFQQVARLHNDEKNLNQHPEAVVVTYLTNILTRKLGYSTVPYVCDSIHSRKLSSALNISKTMIEKLETAVADITDKVCQSCLLDENFEDEEETT